MNNHIGDTNKMVSDTPRTDEQINGKPCTRFEILAGDSLRNASVQSEFARGLERELNAANDRIKRLEEMYESEPGERPDLLGSNVMGLLKRELNAAQQRIKRLEEAGDYLCAAAAFLGWHDKIDEWNKAKEAKL